MIVTVSPSVGTVPVVHIDGSDQLPPPRLEIGVAAKARPVCRLEPGHTNHVTVASARTRNVVMLIFVITLFLISYLLRAVGGYDH